MELLIHSLQILSRKYFWSSSFGILHKVRNDLYVKGLNIRPNFKFKFYKHSSQICLKYELRPVRERANLFQVGLLSIFNLYLNSSNE